MSEDMFSKMVRWTHEGRAKNKQVMSDSKQRFKDEVAIEKEALDVKRGQLEHFMLQPEFVKLPRAEKDRLYRQSMMMEQYSQVLFERLEADFA